MLAHLRFHRRGPSNPTSPLHPDSSPWDAASLQPAQLVPEDGVPAPEIRPRSSNSLPFAQGHGQAQAHPLHSPPPPPQPPSAPQQQHHQVPTLPPITRVTSTDFSIDFGEVGAEPKQQPPVQSPQQQQQREEPPKQFARASYTEGSGFIGGLALQNYRREQEALMNAGASNRDDIYGADKQSYGQGQTGKPPPPAKPIKAASSFVSPTQIHRASTAGRRPTGMRTGPDPQGLPGPTPSQEAPRGKKGLPFLKNPMSSLLLRRKASQNVVPDLSLPLRNAREEPVYDPRIRGTRVHDFSAPRPRKPVHTHDAAQPATESASQVTLPHMPVPEAKPSAPDALPVRPPKYDRAVSERTSSSAQSQEAPAGDVAKQESQREAPSRQSTLLSGRRRSGVGGRVKRSSLPASLVPISRNSSAASGKGVLSSVPQHMKSTSSRFSFDMVGAANQEKLLEERHRQRQQDKRVDEYEDYAPRDSRFDEFDEDAFDYDAMDDYDDGLEERIPGVNADLDDEEDFGTMDDPDNDQENFAGFVFQRSDPTTTVTSPHSAGVLPTPRDANGDVIGYASTETGEMAGLRQDHLNPPGGPFDIAPLQSPRMKNSAGLGIQSPETNGRAAHSNGQPAMAGGKVLSKDDELYFVDSLIHNFDGEGDGSAFDESIFDLDDTDQYGRPIPGMFARALSQKNAENAAQQAKKGESDITSRLSQQSGLSRSTAHTSLSADQQSKAQDLSLQDEKIVEPAPQPPPPSWTPNPQDSIAAYQAALAAAAHQAAASGKFRRDSSPPPPANPTVTSPTTSGSVYSDHSNENNENAVDDYEYDDGGYTSAGLDDYELDDDAIIAEANASALANDTDGWYGQEFGFYSAPVTQHHSSAVLTEKNLYQYSHGGYFGPSGANRTTLGRIVSREPSLTPITERSEYSNRNSLMSLMPSSSAAPLQSPGLAQLALMGEDESMSLSALMRFRSKAWGSSQASIASSRDGSPYDRNGATSPWDQDNNASHWRKSSTFSIRTQDSGAGSGDSGSPTLTMSMSMPNISNSAAPPLNTMPPNPNPSTSASPPPLTGAGIPAPLFSPPPPPPQYPHSNRSSACPPVFEDEEADDTVVYELDSAVAGALATDESNQATPGRKAVTEEDRNMAPRESGPKHPGMGHRHRGSADSISYMREEESGETRWVMERRRTADSGEIEILGREVIERGRI
ncbi:hypothetical protein DL764_000324 [Monosporascus ibericus]|uniref:AGC-kinase C-terminal domain-containing protein n=1 Tax=Monosporascus ibericus TaxID=155417 RepID=A0A4Q4TVL8_9PEZI|nr:hypothetical protein DL764_000324 [Monosporascus ibericus]